MKAVIDTNKKQVEVTLESYGRSTTAYFDSSYGPKDVIRNIGLRPYPVLSKHEWAIVNRAAKILEAAASRYNPPDIDGHTSEDVAIVENICLSRGNIFDLKASIVANVPAERMKVNTTNGAIELERNIIDAIERLDFLDPHLEVEYGFNVSPLELYQMKSF